MIEQSEAETDQPPTTWIMKLSKALLREPHDRNELIELLQKACDKHILDPESFAMIEGVLEVSDLKVRDIMIPRSQMTVLERDATLAEILPIITDSGHSRFPVIGEDRDDVIGILLAKDLLNYHFKHKDKPFEMSEILRKAVFVPESKRVDNLLREFRLNHNHMAIVIDEYGGVAGLVTIEDVLEQIVGKIEDEYDTTEEPNIRQQSEHTYLVKALTPIEEFNQYFHEELSDEESDTIGGYLIQQLGYLPKRGETVRQGNFRIKILASDNRRLKLLQVRTK